MLSFMHHFHVDFEMVMLFQANFFPSFFFSFKNGVRVLLYNLRTKYFDFFLLLYIFFSLEGK